MHPHRNVELKARDRDPEATLDALFARLVLAPAAPAA